MRGGRVAVVGGSIAGCAAALAASRCGADEVVVYERAGGELQDRGVGLGVNDDRYAELCAAGFMDDGIPWVRLASRRWFASADDESGSPASSGRSGSPVGFGRQIAVQPFPFRGYTWGSLWRGLRGRVPDSVRYHTDSPVASVADGPDGAVVQLTDGSVERFDVVIGADGYRSVVRAAMFPDAVPQYAGYLLWRGTFPAERLAEVAHLAGDGEAWNGDEAVTIGLAGGRGRPVGHVMTYRIPADGGGENVNWALYATAPEGLDLNPETPKSLPPGTVTKALIDHLHAMIETQLPPYWGAVFRRTEPGRLAVQPIYDLEVSSVVGSRLLLTGDAAAVARPHGGGGAVKALQDAAVLETVWHAASTWDEVLSGYDAERRPVGHAMVAMGRRVGEAQVTDAPDWARYNQERFDAWWQRSLATVALGGLELRRG